MYDVCMTSFEINSNILNIIHDYQKNNRIIYYNRITYLHLLSKRTIYTPVP